MNRRRLVALPIMALVIAADQITKWLIVTSPRLARPHSSLEILPFFSLVHWTNKGISFGLLNALNTPDAQRNVLAFLTIAILAVLAMVLCRAEKWLTIVALGLIMGGAIGNLIDRLLYGAVTDFLYFHYLSYDFPAFNVADSCVCIGVGLMLLEGFGAGGKKSASFSDG
jgi:signal peptidase II